MGEHLLRGARVLQQQVGAGVAALRHQLLEQPRREGPAEQVQPFADAAQLSAQAADGRRRRLLVLGARVGAQLRPVDVRPLRLEGALQACRDLRVAVVPERTERLNERPGERVERPGHLVALRGLEEPRPAGLQARDELKALEDQLNEDDAGYKDFLEAQEAERAEQKEIVQGLETIIRKITFVKGREMFEHLDAILYDKVVMEGDKARLKTTVVVHRNYKKAEIIIDFVLAQEGGAWKVLDTIMLGDSTLGGIRDDQVQPLIQKGGVAAVMQALRERVAELNKA